VSRLAFTISCALAAVGVTLFFTFKGDPSRSALVQHCLAKRGFQLHHETQNLSVTESEVVAVLNGTNRGGRVEAMFFKGPTERTDALDGVRVDLDDWKAPLDRHTHSVIAVIGDAVVGWSAPPASKTREVFSACLK
jgi:hypothetical protein